MSCSICSKTFSQKSTLNRHLREVHGDQASTSTWGFKCLEPNCIFTYARRIELIEHLTVVHSMIFNEQVLNFNKMEEFTDWKRTMEEATVSSYLAVEYGDKNIRHFKCNRSRTGQDKRDSNKIYDRNSKSQGNYHMDTVCTSRIKVICKDGSVLVNFQDTHYGHTADLSKMRLPKHEKDKIASKLMSGVPCKRIMQSVSDDIGEHLKRIDLITSRDVYNIKKSYGIQTQEGKCHENDSISVDLWVQENLSKGDENPVLFYKKQDTESPLLDKQDFCLIIMNKFQKYMLSEFGNGRVTIDGTHGLNAYDFELTTIMVLDEYNQGFPVSFMFTNRKDTSIYKLFFQHIKEKIGEIKPKIFMTDMAMAYINAWVSVMGDTNHFLCAWHVDRAWQINLSKIKPLEKRMNVKKTLKILQQCRDKAEFNNCLNGAVNLLMGDSDTCEFGKYFVSTYSHNVEKWAYCYRDPKDVNTNMHLESMHKTLKYVYADRRTIKRLDKALFLILQFLKEKCRERLVKLIKGKNTNNTREIFIRHCSAQRMEDYQVEHVGGMWHVKKDSNTSYRIEKIQEANCCTNVCRMCDICCHIYKCNCTDYTLNNSICKHIHYVAINKTTVPQKENEKQNIPNSDFNAELDMFCNSYKKNNECDKGSKLITNFNNIYAKLESLDIDKLNEDAIENINFHLSILNNLMNMPKEVENEDFTKKDNTNLKYIEPQQRFFSTKNKRSLTLRGLTDGEREETKKMLKEMPALVISSDPAEDHRYC